MRLAIYNFGIQHADFGDPAVAGFALREPVNFLAAELAEGFIGRSGYDGEPGPASWGEQVFPRFLKEAGRQSGVSSLSLWASLEALMAFTYSGVHADALKHARHWNISQQWPALVLWWVEADHVPAWAEAVQRFEHLHDNGPTPDAFTLKQAYAADGSAAEIDRALVKAIIDKNKPVQVDLLAKVKAMPV